EQRLFAVVIVIKARLGEPEGARYVADRGGVEAAIPEDLGRGAADFGPPGVRPGGRGASLTAHRVSRGIMRPTDRSVGLGGFSLRVPRITYEKLEWGSRIFTRSARNCIDRVGYDYCTMWATPQVRDRVARIFRRETGNANVSSDVDRGCVAGAAAGCGIGPDE